MRVLYSFPHRLGSPGIGTTALHQVRGLAAAGAEVVVACTSCDLGDVPAEVVETMRLVGHRVPHRAIGTERAYRLHDARVARLLLRGRGRYDVVHTWPLAGVRTLEAAALTGVTGLREVPNSHTAYAYEQSERECSSVGVTLSRGDSHRPSPARLRREEREYAAAAALLVPSDHVAATFAGRGVDLRKLQRHRYGYDPAVFGSAGRPGRGASGLRALFVGRLEPRKGVHYALQAWQLAGGQGAGAGLTVCGATVQPEYRRYLRPWLGSPEVRAVPFTDDVSSLMRSADVLVLPSVDEGSALVVYEAMASGCVPLVSSAVGAPVTHGVDGLVHEPRDVATLAEHLRLLRSDDRLLERLREGVAASSPSLTWDAAGRRLLEIYQEVSGDGLRRRRVS